MTIPELQLKLLLKKAELEVELAKYEDGDKNGMDLFVKWAYVFGVLTGLSKLTVDEETVKKLYKILDNKDGEDESEKFIDKIYKE